MSAYGRSYPGPGSTLPRFPGTFVLAFHEAATSLNWQVHRWVGHLVECTDDQGRIRVVAVENVYRRIRREDRLKWQAVLASFLRNYDPADPGEGPPPPAAGTEPSSDPPPRI